MCAWKILPSFCVILYVWSSQQNDYFLPRVPKPLEEILRFCQRCSKVWYEHNSRLMSQEKNVHIMAMLHDDMLDVKIGSAGSMPRSLSRTARLRFNLRRNKGTLERQSRAIIVGVFSHFQKQMIILSIVCWSFFFSFFYQIGSLFMSIPPFRKLIM